MEENQEAQSNETRTSEVQLDEAAQAQIQQGRYEDIFGVFGVMMVVLLLVRNTNFLSRAFAKAHAEPQLESKDV